jgi:hypothetical protein
MAKRRDLNASHTLGCTGRNNSKPSIGSHGHAGGTSPGQTRKTPKDLSAREREDRGRGEGVGLYAVHMCKRGGGVGREECGLRSARRVGTGRVRAQKRYLCCNTHLDTSVSRT